MPQDLQNVKLSSNSLYITVIFYFVLFKNFNSNMFACLDVSAKFYFTKSALSDCFA